QAASKQCNQIGKKLGQACQSMSNSHTAGASGALGEAGDMLSEMEMLAEELSDMQLQLSQLDSMKDAMSDAESRGNCDCTGACDGSCNGGKRRDWARGAGNGAGFRDRSEDGNIAFKRKKAKVRTGRGDVIGTMFIKGRQLRGDTHAAFVEAAEAAEREATDAIEKERIPRSYHRVVKQYFDRFGELEKTAPPKPAEPKKN
ncbi:MAG: hypothetical protein V3T70_04275, partial [Phycisphaerae bacterium]